MRPPTRVKLPGMLPKPVINCPQPRPPRPLPCQSMRSLPPPATTLLPMVRTRLAQNLPAQQDPARQQRRVQPQPVKKQRPRAPTPALKKHQARARLPRRNRSRTPRQKRLCAPLKRFLRLLLAPLRQDRPCPRIRPHSTVRPRAVPARAKTSRPLLRQRARRKARQHARLLPGRRS